MGTDNGQIIFVKLASSVAIVALTAAIEPFQDERIDFLNLPKFHHTFFPIQILENCKIKFISPTVYGDANFFLKLYT